MVAGTDACGAAHIIPGFSLHDEFDLLAEDPLTDHTALRRIAGVLREGSWWSRADLGTVLERVAAAPGAR
ncbi:hypothetical protein OHR86_01395 [Streptomyces sp. NBC_00441]|uniref:hypothetical protein n=1 Tax=Streptomyces sp. NBC_00441 TaxID=2975742 RepID=UPI002E2C94A0|nr:hypothetical protein [Streptomyces sp. NBC_00441]